ncbi:FecR family protein [Pedobacter sp. P26]|uniref:FecR family protein n=1 Tax=Pedobacter sp. P26 TaxID=3423956 RepID=UPI003D66DEFE
MDKQQAKELVQRYNQGLVSAEEKAKLENWYMQKSDSLYLKDDEIDFDSIAEELSLRTFQYAGILSVKVPAKRFKLWQRIAAAAAIILVIGGGIFYCANQSTRGNDSLAELKAHDIAPGYNKAVLTLANGQQISLTDAKNGKLANEANTVIKKTADGQLVYMEADETQQQLIYNTISTPVGGQYTLILSEGTKVILNAASSLKYPAQFKGKDRVVELSGEGYFEVAHDQSKPFKVISRGQTVEVLGTHFNINSYLDEPNIKTTLLEGSVNVNGTIIKPKQQAIFNNRSILVREVEPEEVVAWKNGLFKFDHTDIHTLMRQIARWYDVEVVYEGTVKDGQFYGKIERSYTLSEVLKVLELGNLHFRVEGRKIIVLK